MATRSLAVLSTLFACAFFGRAAVMAEELTRAPDGAPEKKAAAGASCISGPLAEELRTRLKETEEKEAALSAREEKLKALAAHIDTRTSELEALNKTVAASVSAAKEARNADVRRVAAMYEGMKPAAAGAIIARMDPSFAASLLLSMNSETASAIMASLEADRAYAITVLMAEEL
jgi:flagellar motility protein MotE (MotC chaperone)